CVRNPSFSIDQAADLDFGEQTCLKDPNLAHPNKLQQSQKGHCDLGPTRRRREKSEKGNWLLTLNRPHDKVNFVRDREAFFENLTKIFALQLDFFKHLLKCADQI